MVIQWKMFFIDYLDVEMGDVDVDDVLDVDIEDNLDVDNDVLCSLSLLDLGDASKLVDQFVSQ